MNVEQNLALFRELMLCDGDIYSWSYDCGGKLLYSNCPDQAVFATVFDAFGCLEKMLKVGETRELPIFLGSDTGLVWGVAFEKREGVLQRCHVIGPVFFSSVSMEVIYRGIKSKDWNGYSSAWLHTFYEAIYRVPTSQYTIFSRNLRMLHYCVTAQRVTISDVFVDDISVLPSSGHQASEDRHRIYNAEKAMLEMVKLGDLNYSDALNTSMLISDGIQVTTENPVQQARISCIVFCSIVCRAAIEGGLSPEAGYSLGDAYIQSAADAKTIDEISTICIAMYDDFIRRVHQMRENPHYSKPIQRCCEYIEMNLDRNIRGQELAGLVGYSVTYLTRRFREETGFGISDYIKAAKVERAKILLASTDKTVQEISDQLGFTTRSYFSTCFRQITGLTPKEFREKK